MNEPLHSHHLPQQLTDVQIERWRTRQAKRSANQQHMQHHAQHDAARRVARTQMLALLKRFLTGQIDIETFRATFDRNTRSAWNQFGFKGPSGAMFLNTLVKHIPDQNGVTQQLRAVLPLPEDASTDGGGRAQMQHFYDYLVGLERAGAVTRRQVQVARVPFFISMWWHLQEPEAWPVFYPSGRRMLEAEDMYSAAADPVEDYFAFRASFLALAEALQLPSWELEHLLDWCDKAEKTPVAPEGSAPASALSPSTRAPAQATTVDEDEFEEENEPVDDTHITHSQVQLLLAQIGRKLGCHVWIASNDHNRTWQGKRLGDVSIDALPPLGLDPNLQRMISLIDVIWLQGTHRVAAAFEVEHTTSVYSGLLRMSDLVAVTPNLNFPLYIVTPQARMDKVKRELSRPTFQMLNLHEQCGFFSFETLVQEAPSIMRWANEPGAIGQLAEHVESTTQGW